MSQVTDEPVRAAFDKLRGLSADAEARRLAFVRERALRDELTLLKEARAEGHTEGHAEGLAEGEAKARRTIAIDLIRQTGLDDAAIAAVSRLAVEAVAALRAEQSEG
jgi:hypothetical protein